MKEFKSPYIEALQKARKGMSKEASKLAEEDDVFAGERMCFPLGTVIATSSGDAKSTIWTETPEKSWDDRANYFFVTPAKVIGSEASIAQARRAGIQEGKLPGMTRKYMKTVNILENLFEDLVMLVNRKYRKSMRTARREYEKSETLTHDQVFKKTPLERVYAN